MEDFSSILNNIGKHIELDTPETDYFCSLLQVRQVKKKALVLTIGQVCNSIYFVQSGTLRAYSHDKEGNVRTLMFAVDDWWITDMFSFVQQASAIINIDAVQDSLVFELRKSDLEKLYLQIPKFERFFRIIFQNAYVREQIRINQKLLLTAEEQYIHFVQKYLLVVQRVPQKQIASYIGITPEFLSAIRRKIAKKEIS